MTTNDYYWIAVAGIFIVSLCFSMYKRRLFGFYVVAGFVGSIAQNFTSHVERLFVLAVIAVVFPAVIVTTLALRDKLRRPA